MVDQLLRAVDLRIQAEETFKKNIVSQIKKLILTLAECDPSNARTALDLTQDQLRQIIIKLNDNSIISEGKATEIANIVKENNLFRGPTPLPSPPSDLPMPTTSAPRDLSGVNPGKVTSSGIDAGRTFPGRTPQTPQNASTTAPPAIGGRRTRRRRKTH